MKLINVSHRLPVMISQPETIYHHQSYRYHTQGGVAANNGTGGGGGGGGGAGSSMNGGSPAQSSSSSSSSVSSSAPAHHSGATGLVSLNGHLHVTGVEKAVVAGGAEFPAGNGSAAAAAIAAVVSGYATCEFRRSNGSMMSTRSGMNSVKHMRNVSVGWIGEEVSPPPSHPPPLAPHHTPAGFMR